MDRIVYTLVTKAGGVDGLDYKSEGGKIVDASFDKSVLEKHKSLPWCEIKAEVFDDEKARRDALAKLSPVDKLFLRVDAVRNSVAW